MMFNAQAKARWKSPEEIEAERQAREAERARAREWMPAVPALQVVLAMFWAERSGEAWDDLDEVEREVRIGEMDRQIRAATNPHYH